MNQAKKTQNSKSKQYSGPTDFVDIDNSRTEEQVGVMEDIIQAGHCPFCLENLKKYHKQPIIWEGKYWLLTKNQWPYKNTKLHLLGILKEHAEDLSALTPAMGTELVEMLQVADKEFSPPGGGLAMRFGDTNYSAGTVKHLHIQFIVPDINSPDFKPTRFKIGKG